RLVSGPPDGDAAQADDVEPSLGHRPRLIGLLEPPENDVEHGTPPQGSVSRKAPTCSFHAYPRAGPRATPPAAATRAPALPARDGGPGPRSPRSARRRRSWTGRRSCPGPGR